MANLRKQNLLSNQTTKAKQPNRPLVAIYCRVSSDKQAKELTIDRQISLTNQIYKRFFGSDPKAQLVDEFQDQAFNLEAKDESREFWKLAALIRAGKINTLIISSDDRVFRGESAKLRGEITDLFRHHRIRLITSNSDTTYSRAETTSRLVSSITQELGSINKLETVKMLQGGRRRKLEEQEKWFLSVCPFGFRCERKVENYQKSYIYTAVESEAEAVRDIFRLYVGEQPKNLVIPKQLAGAKRYGATLIADILNHNKVDRTAWIISVPAGIATLGFDKQKVLRIIRNETYTGVLTVTFSPTTKVAGMEDLTTSKTIPVPAIVPRALFDRAQIIAHKVRARLLDDRTPRTDTNWLHGLIECPKCKERLIGRVANQGTRYYGCVNHHGIYRADDLEQPMERELLSLFTKEVSFTKLLKAIETAQKNNSQAKNAQSQLALKEKQFGDMRKKLEKITMGWADGAVDDATYKSLSKKLKAEQASLEMDLSDLRQQVAQQGPKQNTVESVKQLRQLIQKVTEGPRRLRLLKLISGEIIDVVRLKDLPTISISKMTVEEIRALYKQGRILPKDLREANWSNRRIYSQLGKLTTERRTPLAVEPMPVYKF